MLSQLILDLTRIMAKSRDLDELAHTWQQWHEVTGRQLRAKFVRYVELSNEGARLNGKCVHDVVRPSRVSEKSHLRRQTSVRREPLLTHDDVSMRTVILHFTFASIGNDCRQEFLNSRFNG